MSYEVRSSEVVYKGKVFNIEKDVISLPDGRETTRETIIHHGAAAMLPIDDEGKIIFVRQYRHSARKEVLEIPAGTIEDGEDPYDCAVREIEEETSCKAGKMTFMFKMYSSIGFCNEIIYVYLAENLVKGQFNMDDDEFITIERYSLEESIDLIKKGEICDSKTISAVLAYKDHIQQKQ